MLASAGLLQGKRATSYPGAFAPESVPGLDYVDLYLVHWPIAFRRGPDDFPVRPDGSMVFDESVDPADSYAALERLVEKGLARDIGVANHNQKQVEDIIRRTKVRILFH